MTRTDKIAFVVLLAVVCGVGLGGLWLVKSAGIAVFGLFAAGSEGLSWRGAFGISVGLGMTAIILFALVSGDGLLGELPTVLAGFFLLVSFFTVSLALMF